MSKLKKEYSCSLILFNDLLGGKWKQRILWHIINGDNRFSMLQRAISDISHKMLITQLKELEASGLILRHDFGGYPMRVEYELSEKYSPLIPILDQLCKFAEMYSEANSIAIQTKQARTSTDIPVE